MTGSIRNFEKLNFTPKSSVFCFSQGQTSEYDRLAHNCLVRKRFWVDYIGIENFITIYSSEGPNLTQPSERQKFL